MDPGKKRSRRRMDDPLAGRPEHVGRLAAGKSKARAVASLRQPIVVLVETAAQSKAAIENERADECACSIARRFQPRGQRLGTIIEPKGDVVPDTMMRR